MRSDAETTLSRDSAAEALPLSIAHVIHAIAPEVGGPAVTVPTLCDELAALGHQVRLHVTAYGRSPPRSVRRAELRVHPSLRFGGRLGVSPAMHRALVHEATAADVVHSHGLWLFTNLDAHLATRSGRAKIVLSPRGMLEPYALERRRTLKRVLWTLWQSAASRAADCIHVTAQTEYESVRALGLRNPVAIIPNGVAIPPARDRMPRARRRLLFLGRIDHKKGIDILLRAWTRVAPDHPDWEVQIVGPESGHYGAEMRALVAALKTPRVTFSGPAFEAARDDVLASADVFVLPTRSENFGMTVAEALAAGVPAICSKGAPWATLETERCGWWIDVGVEPLVSCLQRVLPLAPAELETLGSRGRAWAARELSWNAQAMKMAAVYRWLASASPPPAYVHV